MKLYHRYSRFAYRRHNHKSDDVRIRWALSLEPGDLINDCSGFNRVVREVKPGYVFNKRGGWAIIGVDFTTEPFGGACSLNYCGVEPALSRLVLEADYLRQYTGPQGQAWLTKALIWYASSVNSEYENYVAAVQRRFNVLAQGGHILDERGVILSEFVY